ncbi:NUDIX hydrolase domain-like protein [Dipodascopsis uninucleata]
MLTKKTIECLQRIRQYTVPPTSWNVLPVSRRAAVLVLLFPDNRGDLQVVLTMRGASLSSFSSQAAFPGGKADDADESPFAIARREAHEEIGFPRNLNTAKYNFEELTILPLHLARNWLCVRPCVAFLSHKNDIDGTGIDICDVLEIDHSAKNMEVSAIFTAPLERFLHVGKGWYKGSWMDWSGLSWRQHIFSVKSKERDIILDSAKKPSVYSVWGLTARILLDIARLGYDEEPQMEYIKKEGDELLIYKMLQVGQLRPERNKAELNIRFTDLFSKDLLDKL